MIYKKVTVSDEDLKNLLIIKKKVLENIIKLRKISKSSAERKRQIEKISTLFKSISVSNNSIKLPVEKVKKSQIIKQIKIEKVEPVNLSIEEEIRRIEAEIRRLK